MLTRGWTKVLRHLQSLALLHPGSDQGDGALLHRFVNDRDQAAFEILVQRHGSMVFGVCRRIVRQTQDAEDAFQATFLVLVRKAHTLKRAEQLGPWLYGVATRTALKARTAALRKQTQVLVTEPAQ